MLEPTTVLLIAVALLDIGCILLAVVRAASVTATLAWVLAIIAFPGVGAALYLLLARPRAGRAKELKRRSLDAARRALLVPERTGATRAGSAPSQLSPEDLALLGLAESLTGLAPTRGNAVELLAEDERAFDAIEAALARARRTIWAEFYIIQNDDTGRRFLDALAERAAAGVEVRLLYDALGSLRLDARRLRAIEAQGGRVVAFHPLGTLRRVLTFHLRNHRKLVVVDGEMAFTGGMNIGDEYSGLARRRGREHFLDSHMCLRGPAVADLLRTFVEDWHFATGDTLYPPALPPARLDADADAVVAIVPSGPEQEFNANRLTYFACITTARERCFLTSPYFIPDDSTLQALVTASLRGVDVRLLVPWRNDVRIVASAARSYYGVLLRAGVRIFEYRPAMLHAKTLVVDGRLSIVGSANLDIRSFRLNFEVGALVIAIELAQDLERRFHGHLRDSTEVTLEAVETRGLVRRLVQGSARLLSPLL